MAQNLILLKSVSSSSGSPKLHQGERRSARSFDCRAPSARTRNEGPGFQEISGSISAVVVSGWLDGLVQVLQVLKWLKLEPLRKNSKFLKETFESLKNLKHANVQVIHFKHGMDYKSSTCACQSEQPKRRIKSRYRTKI